MPLILAVEPDRRQAAHLTQIVRQRVGAELILAETTELALAQIGNRVPDLILVPALMSPTDDAALAAALRVIATAAHVQMLTTPLFASAAPAPRARGVLAAFRRAKPTKPATDGCDPAEFAQQISSYLESAAEERATAQHTEPPLPVSAPAPSLPVEAPQRYVPLEPGRLYRDEGTTPEPTAASFESELVAEIAESVAEGVEPVVQLETEQLPVDETYVETFAEAAGTLAEPLIENPEPVFETAEPVLESVEPMIAASEPLYESPEPLHDASEPMYAASEALYQAPEPLYETPEPLYETPEPVYETREAVYETPEPVLEASEQTFELPEPVLETPEPMLTAPEPIFETPTVLESTPAPMFEAPDSVAETLEPIIETLERPAARGTTSPRRIGFVVHDVEPETTPLAAESFDIETESIEIAASFDTDFVVEAVSEPGLEPETVTAYSASVDDEAIELVDVDLSSAFSEFDSLLVVDERHDVSVSDVSFNDVNISEIDANDVDVAELLGTPEIVEATAASAAQARVIEFDPLKEFAATLEVLTSSEDTVPIADEAHQAVATGAFEFDDLFLRREPVEPSPLGAWHSWMRLEGTTAEEAWDTPVPAQVVEQAVERAERPVEKRAPERPDWVQLVESLRLDVERRRSEQPIAAPKPPRKAPTRPTQDEWGLFDPAQCGFAALLDKLEEITEANAARPRRSA